jgi:UDP-N-acetylmuramyl tripeptide synthase
MAMEQARTADVVLVAGKGHETGQTVGAETLPFSDVEEIQALSGQPNADGTATEGRHAD